MPDTVPQRGHDGGRPLGRVPVRPGVRAASRLRWAVRTLRRVRRAKFLRTGRCPVCGLRSVFVGKDAFTLTAKKERNDLACVHCGARARTRALVLVLLGLFPPEAPDLRTLRRRFATDGVTIFNASANGAIHSELDGLPGYVGSEYFHGVAPGTFHGGVRCEDLQGLSFSDRVFDLVISEDVLEHVRRPAPALAEVRRVLKPGGHHVFTVPLYGEATTIRVDTSGEEDVYLLPPFYHGDPLRKSGALAYNDFGRDILDLCAAAQLEARIVEFEASGPAWASGDVVVATRSILGGESESREGDSLGRIWSRRSDSNR